MNSIYLAFAFLYLTVMTVAALITWKQARKAEEEIER